MTPQACKKAGITEQAHYRWRKEDRRLQVEQARRLKELEQENVKLKRLVGELSLDRSRHLPPWHNSEERQQSAALSGIDFGAVNLLEIQPQNSWSQEEI